MPKLKTGKPIERHKPYADMTLDDVREEIAKVREEGLKIQSHYKHIEQLYSEWEDKMIAVERMITQMEEDTGLDREEIIKPVDKTASILAEIGIEI